MLKGKTVVLGVTGSISAYKMANVASALCKEGADVHVVMTQNAANFINPITFETLTKNKCIVDTFDRNTKLHVAHITLSQTADVIMIAPASADVIGKLANGIADDMLTSMAVAATCKIMVAPAMNTHMYHNKIVQDNIQKLKHYGFEIIEPAVGLLACRAVGDGKLPDDKTLLGYIRREIECEKDMAGVKVLVTAGPTVEKIDPVRYITNHSTGKMGYAIANCAMLRGANVTLVTGPTNMKKPPFVNVVEIKSAQDMFDAVTSRANEQDIIIKAAAVADYRPANVSSEKVKKSDDELAIELERTQDILKHLGENKKKHQFLCGFSMETQNMLENSRAKLTKKNLDMIVANNLKVSGAGFGTDTNIVTLITKEKETELTIMSKDDVAKCILDEILGLL